MKTVRPSLRARLCLALCSGLLAGCAGPTGPAVTRVRHPFVAAEYHQVYVTGSHIPVLVPKDPGIRRVPPISPLVVLTPDEMQRSMGPAPFPLH